MAPNLWDASVVLAYLANVARTATAVFYVGRGGGAKYLSVILHP